MSRDHVTPNVSFVVDDALNGREVGADPNAYVRYKGDEWKYSSILIGWQCGYECLFVAVHSYIDVQLETEEAIEIATDFLAERDWFSGEPRRPDYVL